MALKFDKHVREIANRSIIAAVLRGVGLVIAFAFNILIARVLGVDDFGLYFIALATVTVASVVSRLGLDNVLLKNIAAYSIRGEWNTVRSIFRTGMSLGLIASVSICIFLYLLAPIIAEYVFGRPELTNMLRWMSFGVVTYSLMCLLSESLKGIREIGYSVLVMSVFYPMVGLTLVVPLNQYFGAEGIAIVFFVGTAAAACFGIYIWSIKCVTSDSVAGVFPAEEFWRSCRKLYLPSLLNRAVQPWLPLILLGVWSTDRDAGVYGAALRISVLTSFFLIAIDTSVAAKYVELYQSKRIESMQKVLRMSTLFIVVLACPLFIILIHFRESIMTLFGHGFESGGTVLVVLVCGQAINTITGSVGILLLMTGHDKDVRLLAVANALSLLFFSILLIPKYGMVGAAIATSMSLALGQIATSYMVYRRVGISILPFISRRTV